MKGWTKEMVRATVETNYPFCNGVTKDEALQLAHDLFCELKQARKETAEKFAERAKEAIINMKWARDDTHIKLVAQGDCLKAIDKIAKEITEGNV